MRTFPLAVGLSLALTMLTACDREGPQGLQGPPGPIGLQGPPGASGAVMTFGYFFALMPGDNAVTVAAGSAVSFPQDGVTSGIARASASAFTLPQIGVYEVSWQASVSEPGQLVLGLDTGMGPVQLARTVAGRQTGTTQITNHVVITTVVANTTLTVRNPIGALSALTLTPLAGGGQPVSASLVIKQLQ